MSHIGLLAWIWGFGHALYLGAATYVLRRPASAPSSRLPGRTLALVLAVGLVPRVLFLPAAPTLSEDLYRYLWDGRVAAHGWNPFASAPSDPSFASWHDANDPLYPRLNHATVPTIYPPAAQGLFALAWRLGGTPLAWKAELLVLEVGLVAALVALLRRRKLPPERLLLYYWNPLVVVECYGSGHVDLAAAAFLALSLSLLERNGLRRQIGAGVALAAAALVKLVPLLLIPALVRRRAWTVLAVAAGAMALGVVPFLGAGANLTEGLRTYARHWEYNGPLYAAIRPWFRTGDEPRLLLAAALAVALAAIAWRSRTLSGAALASWTAFLLLSPTVYPWYLVPLVALLPLHPDPGLLLFSGTVALTYLPLPLYRATGVWSVPAWIRWVEYGSLAATWLAAAGNAALAARAQARRAAWATESSPT